MRTQCKKCGRFLSRRSFPIDSNRASRLYPYCLECKSAEQRCRSKKRSTDRLSEKKVCERCLKREPDAIFDGRNKRLCVECKQIVADKDRSLRKVQTKQCVVCGVQKLISSYSTPYAKVCSECFTKTPAEKRILSDKWHKKRIKDKSRRDEYKKLALNMLGGRCAKCDIAPSDKWPLACFDFHHKQNKRFFISRLLHAKRSRSEELRKELEGCIVLCANCHRAEHARIDEQRRETDGTRN